MKIQSIIAALLAMCMISAGLAESMLTPKQTVLRALEAIQAEDKATLESCFAIGDGNEDFIAWMQVMLRGEIALQRLQRLWLKKSSRISPKMNLIHPNLFVTSTMIRAVASSIDAGTLQVERAKVHLVFETVDMNQQTKASTKPAFQPATMELPFKKIGDDWKIDAYGAFRSRPVRTRYAVDFTSIEREQRELTDIYLRMVRTWEEIADGMKAN